MHSEWGSIDAATADRLNAVRAAGGRLIAVGTTSLRLIESAAGADGLIHPFEGDTDIFITPGYGFKAIGGLMTNFHLPKSTLFMLVSALMGARRCKPPTPMRLPANIDSTAMAIAACSYLNAPSDSSPVNRTMCNTLVEPGVPNGTPAMMMIRPPACPRWYRNAIRLPLATISSNEPISLGAHGKCAP